MHHTGLHGHRVESSLEILCSVLWTIYALAVSHHDDTLGVSEDLVVHHVRARQPRDVWRERGRTQSSMPPLTGYPGQMTVRGSSGHVALLGWDEPAVEHRTWETIRLRGAADP